MLVGGTGEGAHSLSNYTVVKVHNGHGRPTLSPLWLLRGPWQWTTQRGWLGPLIALQHPQPSQLEDRKQQNTACSTTQEVLPAPHPLLYLSTNTPTQSLAFRQTRLLLAFICSQPFNNERVVIYFSYIFLSLCICASTTPFCCPSISPVVHCLSLKNNKK